MSPLKIAAASGALRNERGQSLVGTIAALGILSFIALGAASMLSQQNREMAALSEGLAVAELRKVLTNSMADGSVCKYVLNAASGTLTFNSAAVSSTSTQSITVPKLYTSITAAGVPGAVFAATGSAPSAYAKTVTAGSIQLVISGAPSPMPPAGPGATFTGNWVVNFDNTKTVRSLMPASSAVTLTVDTTNPSAATITGCQGGTNSGPQTCLGQLAVGVHSNGSLICQTFSGAPCTATDTQGNSFSGVVLNGNQGRCCVSPATLQNWDSLECVPF
jgi:hypothetical protein